MSSLYVVLLVSILGDYGVQDVVDAHAASLAQVREIECRIEKHFSNPKPNGEVKKGEWIWSASLKKEKEVYDDRKLKPDGWLENYYVRIYDSSPEVTGTILYLKNYPNGFGKSLELLNQGTVRGGVIEKQIFPCRYMCRWATDLLLRYPYGASGVKLLPEFVSAGKDARIIRETSIGGNRVVQLRVVHGRYEEVENTEGLNHTDFYLDPAKGFLTRKVVHYEITDCRPRTGKEKAPYVPFVRSVEITDFKSLGEGVIFPLGSISTAFQSETEGENPVSVQTVSVSDLKVNGPVSSSAFEVAFPENLLVQYDPPQGDALRIVIWGKENQPQREFRGEADLKVAMERKNLGPRYLRFEAIVSYIACAILIGGLVLLRRRWRSG